ncbi:transposase, partial [Companilactobacillus huachuanensis]
RWLIGDFPSIPSYRTINRFRSKYNLNILMNGLFKAFRDYLRMIGSLDNTALFIDGTKLLSKSNKYTFVWRKAVVKSETNLNVKTSELYKELTQEDLIIPELPLGQRPLTSGELTKISNELNNKVDKLNYLISSEGTIPGGSPNKRLRRHYKHLLHLLTSDYIPRKQRYEYDNSVFGDRNSFSKTDVDATFMRMKEDPMKNGQLKPGYNLQVASQKQFALYYQVFQRPTDTRTLIPFMKTIFKQTPHAANYIVADAGYGSETNYQSLTDDFEVKYLIPYGTYEKELTKKYHKDRRKVENWIYDEKSDEFQDMDGIVFKFHNYSTRHNKYGDEKSFKVYQTVKYFEDPHRETLATTKSGRRRQ